ncbi:PilW family protein [Ferrigenium kumadai]|nr:PilW family protein [Ferrigenium kumadai]
MMNFPHKLDNSSAPAPQSGFSLVELMVALTIGLILLAGITTLIVRQSSSRTELEKTSRQIENGRYAMEILRNDIKLAGYYGEYSPPLTTSYAVPADPCDITAANQGWDSGTQGVPVPVYGYTGAATTPSCVTNRLAGTSILVVRRTATPAIAAGGAVAGTTYLQVSRCNTDTSAFAFGTSGFNLKQKDCATLAPLHKYIVRLYYISSCSVCTGSADTVPTLKMVEFIDGAQTTIPLVEGIEDMQFDYGVAASSTSGSPATYTTTPTVDDWGNVMAIRVNLLVRNNDPTAGYTDTKTYALGGAGTVTPGGPYMRHVYSQVVRLVNPSGRRE